MQSSSSWSDTGTVHDILGARSLALLSWLCSRIENFANSSPPKPSPRARRRGERNICAERAPTRRARRLPNERSTLAAREPRGVVEQPANTAEVEAAGVAIARERVERRAVREQKAEAALEKKLSKGQAVGAGGFKNLGSAALQRQLECQEMVLLKWNLDVKHSQAEW